jgi:hypothetical protein
MQDNGIYTCENYQPPKADNATIRLPVGWCDVRSALSRTPHITHRTPLIAHRTPHIAHRTSNLVSLKKNVIL